MISPLLANIALHGMEEDLRKAYTTKEGKPTLIRYADDFVVLHSTRQGVEKAKSVLEEWLGTLNLKLSPEKTRIAHTLNALEAGRVAGFDFLGFHVRQYRVGKTHSGKTGQGKPLGFKTLIKPSKEAIKRHNRELREIVRKHQSTRQETLIGKLNPVITGWANYYRTVIAKVEYSRSDDQLFHTLRTWAKRRHPHKAAGWVVSKYWGVNKGNGWTFTPQHGQVLKRHDATPIVRHVKVQGTASPYDGNLLYWTQRLRNHPMLRSRVGALLQAQGGKCAYCGLTFRSGDLLEVDPLIPRNLGGDGSMKNLQVMHRHCHDQKTAKDGVIRQGWGIDDNDSLIEEPDASKGACPVL